ncbi:MAG: DUF4173 domain-containing protein [Bacteroidales bacterium]|nr:DUF4173 domain-containing protein [Bacteroidales bacterium]
MKKRQIFLINLATALFFALIFYKNYIGLNLFLFELLVVPIMFYINRPVRLNGLGLSVLAGVFLSALMVVLLNTNWSIFINITSLFILSGILSYKNFRSFIHAFIESFFRLFSSQISILLDWDSPTKSSTTSANSKRNISLSKVFYLFVIPSAIIILFIILYASASSKFYDQFAIIFRTIRDFLESISFIFLLMIILGLIIGNVLYMKTTPLGLLKIDTNGNDNLYRIRRKSFIKFKNTGLKTQCLSGIVLLASLNILILYFNILDFTYLWFGFDWDGSFLKEFVHEGTWGLVFSVFISAGIALYFFRHNLNFYSKNKWLKRLTIIWIAQNIIMVVSVVLRNYWYINYFGLAYKRIAVLFFLLLTIIGLVTIIIKISQFKSTYYLWRVNGFALFTVLILTTCVNWDMLIAKFNFQHYDRSFIDYRFMSKLNNSALPYTLKTIDELEEINKVQQEIMPFDINLPYLWDIYMYQVEVSIKKKKFIKRHQHTNLLEWNLADYQTFKKLKQLDKTKL